MRCRHCPPRRVRRKIRETRTRQAEDLLDAGRVDLSNGGSIRVAVRRFLDSGCLVVDVRYFTATGSRSHAGFTVPAEEAGTLLNAVTAAARWLAGGQGEGVDGGTGISLQSSPFSTSPKPGGEVDEQRRRP